MLKKDEFERYDRFIKIDKVGIVGQEKLKKSSVAVIGAGGLGSPILLYLTAMGVGKIGIVEGDKVTVSNLGRQILFTENEVGIEKAIVAKEKLKKLNHEVEIEPYLTWISDDEIASNIFAKYDAIIDATDNFETRYIINRVAVALDKPLFIGAVGRFVGQIMNVFPHKTACLNCVFPQKEKRIVQLMTQRTLNQGVSAPLVGIVGSIVANEYMKYVLSIGEGLLNKLLIYDSLNNEFSLINLEKDPNCNICSI